MADPVVITDPNATLIVGARYLFYFKAGRLLTDSGLAAALSDSANVHNEFVNSVADSTGVAGSQHIEILGTTVNRGTGEFIVDVRIKGTPVILVIELITTLVFILAAGYVLLQFNRAVLVPIGTGLGSAVDKLGTGLEKIGEAVANVGSGAGSGLQYALPVAGIGLSILFVLYLFGTLSLAKAGRK